MRVVWDNQRQVAARYGAYKPFVFWLPASAYGPGWYEARIVAKTRRDEALLLLEVLHD